jgi:hypothetical protein
MHITNTHTATHTYKQTLPLSTYTPPQHKKAHSTDLSLLRFYPSLNPELKYSDGKTPTQPLHLQNQKVSSHAPSVPHLFVFSPFQQATHSPPLIAIFSLFQRLFLLLPAAFFLLLPPVPLILAIFSLSLRVSLLTLWRDGQI